MWAIKQQLQKQETTELVTINAPIYIVDGFPLPVSHFKRAKIVVVYKEEAEYGYCASKEETY
ncbi:hypothetical protein KCM76_13805 [Zooshikella marina]|uniref:hypothetical protein n=1 Tax=Zooshikella ganghwensis TaxID=202772 RepID=UPI001BB06875|nr:hypothetical protein [Zooshikella ganghwensis]MBU2707065.1 hypothetical protein [Zooshikella ganghwensis]